MRAQEVALENIARRIAGLEAELSALRIREAAVEEAIESHVAAARLLEAELAELDEKAGS